MKNFYKTLGVEEDATQTEIKRVYRNLIRKLHPDLNPNADINKFNEVQKAYETLGNPKLRDRYDRGVDLDIEDFIDSWFEGYKKDNRKLYTLSIPIEDGYRGGKFNVTEELIIELPPGTRSGEEFGIKDCAVKVEIVPSNKLYFRGNILSASLDLSYKQLVLGDIIPFTLPNGEVVKVVIPEFSDIGDVVTVEGFGYGGDDLDFVLDIDMPLELSESQRKVVEMLD